MQLLVVKVYHRKTMQISQKKALIILICIVAIAAFIRLFKLGMVPHGLTWDEAAIGYNGYAIVTTRRDEWLTKLPVSFKSFGDYKAPLAVYVTGSFTTLLGADAWALRLPFAISGVAAVVSMYYLGRLLFKSEKYSQMLSLSITGLAALNPWHIFFSRAGFESGLALTLVILMAVLFLKGLAAQKDKTIYWFIGAAFLGVLSIYAYHSSKVFTPLFVFGLALTYRKDLLQRWQATSTAVLVASIALLPFLKDAFWGNGLERAGVTVFSRGSDFLSSLLIAAEQFVAHLAPSFIVQGATTTLRHGTGSWGVLLPTTAFLVFVFLLGALHTVLKRKHISREWGITILWVVLGVLPAAIATESPHPNRSLLALPGFMLAAGFGLAQLLEWLEKSKLQKKWLDSEDKTGLLIPSVLGTLLNLHILLFAGFAHTYFADFNTVGAEAFQDGYQEAVELAREYEKGKNGKPKVDQIVFSRGYGQPYIYILHYNQINPIAYQGGILLPYLFVDEITVGDLQRKNTLLVATDTSELPEKKATHLIYGESNQVRFKLYYLPPAE